ncbi:MAG: chloride channel protein [Oscillospiraceae bacterium]|nr:chloride channel protein [Oscillospiraceae bacterium]
MKRKRTTFRWQTRQTLLYIHGFFAWVGVGLALGILGGLVGAAFCHAIKYATLFRSGHSWIVWLLPAGGLLIVWLYGLRGMHPTDTNGILLAIHSPSTIPGATAPLIFGSTVVTHLLGGSAGREGAALQLGGVLGYRLGRLLKLNEKDVHLVVMCGMSAVFAALFGSPLTAAVFAIEVASVGILHFSAILPCLTSALTASYLARFLGAETESFLLPAAFPFRFGSVGAVMLIAAACAVVSILYCVALRRGGKLWAKAVPNPYLRAAAGGLAVAVLTWALGTTAYNGAGMDVIAAAMAGQSNWYDFLLKLIFTVITMTSGFKGGEIVPAMFIGATLGCVLGSLLGLPAGLGAAVGLLGMFCGSLNCPLSSILLGVELFGAANIQFFAIAAAISFMLSANYGLYKEQKIVYSKIHPEFIDRYTDF